MGLAGDLQAPKFGYRARGAAVTPRDDGMDGDATVRQERIERGLRKLEYEIPRAIWRTIEDMAARIEALQIAFTAKQTPP